MYKKTILALSVILVMTVLAIGVSFQRSHSKKQLVSNFIERMGGNSAIKKKCLENLAGDIHMDTGEVVKRYLSVDDIIRTDKICDCVVWKLYEMLGNKKTSEHLPKIIDMPSNLAEPVFDVFINMSHSACEAELSKWLGRKYKTIVIER